DPDRRRRHGRQRDGYPARGQREAGDHELHRGEWYFDDDYGRQLGRDQRIVHRRHDGDHHGRHRQRGHRERWFITGESRYADDVFARRHQPFRRLGAVGDHWTAAQRVRRGRAAGVNDWWQLQRQQNAHRSQRQRNAL